MKHLAPACFRAFACAAGACPDSCCRAGWEIVPDEETLNLYQNLDGAEGARIREGIVPGDEPLLRQNAARVCVLLDADGLCHVQRHFGHEALCRVCREYPRFHREFGGLTEHGLSLSCPTAYALAVSAPPAWAEWEDDAPPVPNELDPAAYLRLRKGRALALELLTRTKLPLRTRLTLLRRLAASIQAAPERRIKHDYAIRLRRWSSLPTQCRDKQGLSLRPGHELTADCGSLARRFLELEILSPAWRDALERFAALADGGRTAECRPYTAEERVSEDCLCTEELLTPPDPEPYARWLWYELYKYWMDALDDGQLPARVDRALLMLLLGLAMDRTLPGEGGFLRRLSREIEHCEENLDKLLEICENKWVCGAILCRLFLDI